MSILPNTVKLRLAGSCLEWWRGIPFFQILLLCTILSGCQLITQEVPFAPSTLPPDPGKPVSTIETLAATPTSTNTAIPVTPSSIPVTPSATAMPPTPSPTITSTPTPFKATSFLLYGIVIDEDSQIYALQPGGESHFVSTGQMLPGQALSPDGTKLIIDTNDRSQPPLSPEKVFMLSLETGEKSSMNLLAHPRSGIFWSADGNSLLYIDKYSSNDADQLILYDLVSGENQMLVEVEHILVTAGWSEDGETIAYLAEVDGQYDLFIINSETLERQQLTNTSDVETKILWSPTASQLLVGVTPDNGHVFEMWPWGIESLYLVDIVNGDWQLITDKFLTSESVSWSPDGKEILFSDAGLLCIMNLETMIESCPLAEVRPYGGGIIKSCGLANKKGWRILVGIQT
jgi:hypothetical protein